MQEMIFNIFGSYGYFIVPIITGFVSSFVIEAINQYTPKNITIKWINFIVTLIFSIFFSIMFSEIYYKNIFDYILIFIMNLSFSTLFYYIVGRRFVVNIVYFVEEKIQKRLERKISEIIENEKENEK